MAYNRKKEYKKWIRKKEAEEKNYREKGVGEEALKNLRELDKELFNQERRYKKHQVVTEEKFFLALADPKLREPITLEEVLDDLENEALFEIIVKADWKTQRIIELRFQGYKVKEISVIMGISIYEIYRKIKKFKENYKSAQK